MPVPASSPARSLDPGPRVIAEVTTDCNAPGTSSAPACSGTAGIGDNSGGGSSRLDEGRRSDGGGTVAASLPSARARDATLLRSPPPAPPRAPGSAAGSQTNRSNSVRLSSFAACRSPTVKNQTMSNAPTVWAAQDTPIAMRVDDDPERGRSSNIDLSDAPRDSVAAQHRCTRPGLTLWRLMGPAHARGDARPVTPQRKCSTSRNGYRVRQASSRGHSARPATATDSGRSRAENPVSSPHEIPLPRGAAL